MSGVGNGLEDGLGLGNMFEVEEIAGARKTKYENVGLRQKKYPVTWYGCTFLSWL